MSLLKMPSEVTNNVLIKGMIYGQPGVGKSTVSLSMPSPVCIDADNGMYRVEKRLQVPSLPLTDYEKVLELLQSDELDQFQTIVFDTAGKLLDRMADYLMKANPKLRQGDGSLSMKGWGALKMEFQKMLKLAEAKNKHLIFVAHEKEEKDGDTRIVRPDISGSSGKDILKELDFVGYIEMRGDKRSISFTPCEKFYAKNSLKLPQHIELPNTDKHANTFMHDVIVTSTLKRVRSDDELAQKYNVVTATNKEAIEAVTNVETANLALKQTDGAEVIWDSGLIAKRLLWDKAKSLGLDFDKKAKQFIETKKEEKTNEPDQAPADSIAA